MPKSNIMGGTTKLNRRSFIKISSLVVSSTALTGPYLVHGQNLNGKIRVAGIGVGGKGGGDVNNSASNGGEIVALCDVDQNTLNNAAKRFPSARKFKDWRKMLDEMGKEIDACTISTPDHVHALAASMAMRMGKHVYVQKPLTQSVYEARYLRQLAKETKVATQMGNQGSAGNGLRRAVEVIQAGVIGQVRELHVWSNRPIWPQGIDRPAGEDPVPETLDWDLWLGPAPLRPFKKGVYHDFKWRGWRDFGTGALGDMACHTVNMPFRALKMGYPTVVECEAVSDNHAETYPLSSRIRFEFPEREGMVPLKFWWYDGSPNDPKTFRPPPELTKEISESRGKLPGSGCLLVGEKGKLFSPDDYGARFFIRLKDEKELTDGKNHEAVKAIPQTIVRNPFHGSADQRHHLEWIAACKGGPAGYSNFDVAAYLTEIILLGCVALRVDRQLEWDGPNMVAKNAPEAAQFIRRQNRKGWEL